MRSRLSTFIEESGRGARGKVPQDGEMEASDETGKSSPCDGVHQGLMLGMPQSSHVS